jgi:small subunit ribosomal protein S1
LTTVSKAPSILALALLGAFKSRQSRPLCKLYHFIGFARYIFMPSATTSSMEELLKTKADFKLPEPGTLVEGPVISMFKNRILIDIDGIATGMISGREAKDSTDTAKGLKIGDTVSAYVIEGENDEGYIVLSLRKANQEKTWKKFLDAYEKQEVITVKASEANKGGLLLEIDGIKGFIPVSQLAPMHYPRVNDADSNQIFQRLQALVGLQFMVKIINIDKENGKLILSEKAAMEEQRKVSLGKLKVGSKVTGTISGIVKFGIFVAFDGLEGLVHISEIAWGHVKNPGDYGRLGQKVEVMVIGVDGDKISLSMKRLVADPWLEAAKMFKIGSVVEGEVNRLTPFGAFVKLNEEINGLIHITEITGETIKDPSEVLKIGDKVKAKVIAVEPEEHRVGLSIKALTEPAPVVEEEETEEESEKKPAKKKKAAKSDEDQTEMELEEEAAPKKPRKK